MQTKVPADPLGSTVGREAPRGLRWMQGWSGLASSGIACVWSQARSVECLTCKGQSDLPEE